MKNTVVKNSIIYTASGLIMKCFTFFLLPLYTMYLTTEDYGITSIATSFASTMSIIVALSLYSAVARFFVDFKDNTKKLKRFYGTITTFTLISSVIWMVILTVFREWLSINVFSGAHFFPVILICLISLVFNCQHTIYENILRSQQKALKCSIMSVIYFLITLVGNIYFVVVCKMGAAGVLLSTLIAGILYTIVFFVDMHRIGQMEFCLDFPLLKEALFYSIPIIPHNLATQIAVLVSQVLISNKYELGAVGVFSVATQFGNFADTIQIYVNNAYSPWLFEVLKNKEQGYKATIRKTVKVLISIIGFLFIGLALFSYDYIVLFVNIAFVKAWQYVPLIVFVFAIKIAYYFYVNILFYYKRASRFLFIATLTSSFSNILLSYTLIPLYGVFGSIVADGISMIVRVAIVIFISSKFEDIGLRIWDFLSNLFIICFFIMLGFLPTVFYFRDTFNWLNFLYKCVILLVYGVLMLSRYKKQIKDGFLNKVLKKKLL